MKYFLSFMGYPRSGHTLVAAILNANPNVICSNQFNFYGDVINLTKDKLLQKINEGADGRYFKDSTQILHVPKREITVIGDKTGHRTVEILKNNPMKLGKMKAVVEVPIKWIHVVRNPYDNLATWAKLNHQNKLKNNKPTNESEELNNVIQKYEELNETISKLKRSEDILTVNHEYVITRMHNTLEEMANFLEISFDPKWRDHVRNTVWKKPRLTRNQVSWSQRQKAVVNDLTLKYEWLNGYVFGGCGGC